MHSNVVWSVGSSSIATDIFCHQFIHWSVKCLSFSGMAHILKKSLLINYLPNFFNEKCKYTSKLQNWRCFNNTFLKLMYEVNKVTDFFHFLHSVLYHNRHPAYITYAFLFKTEWFSVPRGNLLPWIHISNVILLDQVDIVLPYTGHPAYMTYRFLHYIVLAFNNWSKYS